MRELRFWRDDLKPKLQATLSLYVGYQARMDLAPKIQAIEDWLAEQLVLSFAADAGGAITPLEKMGMAGKAWCGSTSAVWAQFTSCPCARWSKKFLNAAKPPLR